MGSKSGDKSKDKKHKSDKDKSRESSKSKSSEKVKSKSKDKSISKSPKKEKEPKSPKSPKSNADSKSKRSSRKGSVQSQQIDLNDLKLPQQEQNQNEKMCVHHNIELSFFCESCEEPICRQCTILGPHNNQLHRINRVEEAFRARVGRLSETIKNNLLVKRDQLLAQIHRIEYRIEEIRYVKTVIERDARAEYGGIIERLKSAEGIKIAVLQHEMSELQRDLDRINDVGHNFNEFTKDQNQPIGFLLRSRNLYENIEHLVAKPFKVNIDVVPYDLPRELTEMRLQLQKVHAQKALIDFKNEVLWKLVEEKKQGEEKLKQSMENAAYEELQQWAQLTDKLQKELQQYTLVCFYCGVALDEQSVNKKCTNNLQSLDSEFQGYSDKVPDTGYHGNHRHYFGKPKQDLMDMVHNGQKNSQGKSPFTIFVEVQMGKIKKTSQEKGLDLEKIFQDHDKHKNGTLNYIQFKYILTEILELAIPEVEKLIKYLDKDDKKYVNYGNFLVLVNDPSLVEKYDLQDLE